MSCNLYKMIKFVIHNQTYKNITLIFNLRRSKARNNQDKEIIQNIGNHSIDVLNVAVAFGTMNFSLMSHFKKLFILFEFKNANYINDCYHF